MLDTALLHQVIAGHDPRDSTSVDAEVPDVVGAARAGAAGDLTGVRIGVVKQLRGEGYQPGVLASFNAAVEQLTALGADVSEVDCPHFDSRAGRLLPDPAVGGVEQPGPLRRDALRAAGRRRRHAQRRGGDGADPGRRLRPGSQAAHHDRHLRAVGRLLRRVLQPGAEGAHADRTRSRRRPISRSTCWCRPTTPTTAFPLGEKVDDPLAMYLFDLCTLPLNLAGHCGMSVPSGLSPDDKLPVGLQIMAPALADDRLYRVGAAYEAAAGAPSAMSAARS